MNPANLQQTIELRTAIGFTGLKEAWSNAPIVETKEALQICGHPVMERWEDPYMRALAKVATRHGGRILEVGYGMGISAQYIQAARPTSHIIIEANKAVYRAARRFATSALCPTRVLPGFWEDIVPTFQAGYFDGILFDTYPLVEKEIHTNHFPFFREAYRLLRTGGILTYYSDEIQKYSDKHLACLQQAGFTKIEKEICHVEPPKGCKYWKSSSLLIPIVTK